MISFGFQFYIEEFSQLKKETPFLKNILCQRKYPDNLITQVGNIRNNYLLVTAQIVDMLTQALQNGINAILASSSIINVIL